jgi:hypothetical protein
VTGWKYSISFTGAGAGVGAGEVESSLPGPGVGVGVGAEVEAGTRAFLVTRKLASMCCGVSDSRTLCCGKRKRSSVAPAVVNAMITGREAGGGGTQGF